MPSKFRVILLTLFCKSTAASELLSRAEHWPGRETRRIFEFARPILYEDDGLHEEDDADLDIPETFPDNARIIGRQSLFRQNNPKLERQRYYGHDQSRTKKNSQTTITKDLFKINEGRWSRMKKDWDPTMNIAEIKRNEGLWSRMKKGHSRYISM